MSGDGLIVVGFAGGGGSSHGIKEAVGRDPDIAINHDPEAVAMHAANHPATLHYCQNIWRADPVEVTQRRRVRLAWFSPDCRHFSKAKGGAPVRKNIRDLAWVVVLWAQRARPDVIMLENVEEFRDWGPLVTTEGGKLMPCPVRKGLTFRRWVRELQRLGYQVEHRELRACDYGAPTIRKRLFVIARRDGQPIVWPTPTHGAGLRPYRTAAEIIDWSLPCPSIFLTREDAKRLGLDVRRPLAEATMARIAKGVMRFVIEAADPFIIPITHTRDSRVHSIRDPLRTITCANRGEHALVAPYFVPRYGERQGQEPRTRTVAAPLPTIVPAQNGASLVAAFLAQHNTGMTGHDAREPVSTIVQKGCTQALVASHLINLKGSDRRYARTDAPSPTLCSGGNHVGEVRAFLMKYYGSGGQLQDCREPLHTVTATDRFGIVAIRGEQFQIVDIGMRMLTPRERYSAQGFPPNYTIDVGVDGKRLSGKAQGRMVGNSVSPPVAAALVRANCAELVAREVAA